MVSDSRAKASSRFAEERYQKILETLNEYGRVTVKELCSLLAVSDVTARNDLKTLERQGRLMRTYGGAVAPSDGVNEPPFQFRLKVRCEAKRRIARAAAGMINDGETVFIDGGTTAAGMKFHLADKRGVTLITPSLEIACYLSQHPAIRLFVLGGYLLQESCSTVGVSCAGAINNWIIRKAFYGAYGFTLERGLTDNHRGLIEQKRQIAAKAQINIGLIDSAKWGRVSLDTFIAARDLQVIITDRDAPPEAVAAARQAGIEVVLA